MKFFIIQIAKGSDVADMTSRWKAASR